MIINKTFVVDCISKQIKKNNGERTKYYVENNHPAIIDDITFGKVQEEIARRNSKRKVKQIGTKTELGKYSSKYALQDIFAAPATQPLLSERHMLWQDKSSPIRYRAAPLHCRKRLQAFL